MLHPEGYTERHTGRQADPISGYLIHIFQGRENWLWNIEY
jgi:hypothetical protein